MWERERGRLLSKYPSAERFFVFVGRAGSWLKAQFPTVPALLGVILGVGLKAQWDTAEAAQHQRIEVQRAARSVAVELQSNLGFMDADLDYLKQDIAAADTNAEFVPSLSMFSTVAGQAAFLRGSFDPVSSELTEQVGTVDALLDGLNQRIQQRDLYRFTNAAMDNFQRRRKIFDQDLTGRLQATRSAMIRLIEDVRRVRNPGDT